MRKILVIFGTRPELIKLAPIIDEFNGRGQRDRLYIVNTNQHKDFIRHDLEYFNIDVDHEFPLDRKDDCLSLLNGLLLLAFNALKLKLRQQGIAIDCVMAQGDTCTSFSAAQYAFYEKIPFIHVEAGLRTDDFTQPFPEEYFRKTISSTAAIHFAPTAAAEKKLIGEGISAHSILVTGNTVIDNLKGFKNIHEFKNGHATENGLVLITIHRRENIKNNLRAITERIIGYIKKNPGKSFVWIDNPGYKITSALDERPANLEITAPVSFSGMVAFYKRAQLIITDSGGIQEEAAYLGIPVLLFREKTERTEGIDAGISKYIEDTDNDLDDVVETLNNNRLPNFNTIYGDGYASKRIVDYILERY